MAILKRRRSFPVDSCIVVIQLEVLVLTIPCLNSPFCASCICPFFPSHPFLLFLSSPLRRYSCFLCVFIHYISPSSLSVRCSFFLLHPHLFFFSLRIPPLCSCSCYSFFSSFHPLFSSFRSPLSCYVSSVFVSLPHKRLALIIAVCLENFIFFVFMRDPTSKNC